VFIANALSRAESLLFSIFVYAPFFTLQCRRTVYANQTLIHNVEYRANFAISFIRKFAAVCRKMATFCFLSNIFCPWRRWPKQKRNH